jgi:translation initiation factor IF-1
MGSSKLLPCNLIPNRPPAQQSPARIEICYSVSCQQRKAPDFVHRAYTAGATVFNARKVLIIQKEHDVPKEELLEFDGLVTEILPDARYRVQLDNGHQLVAYTAGRMKKNRIKTLAGDRVTVEVSPYDLEKGRLIFRHKDERAGSLSRPPQRHQFRRR